MPDAWCAMGRATGFDQVHGQGVAQKVEDTVVGGKPVGAGFLDGWGGLGTVEGIEAAGDLAGELDVGDLILADGDEVRLVEEDVG